MISALLAVLVSLSASTGRAAGLASVSAARVTAHATDFPGWSPLGAPDDPLDGLARNDEDLRDAFAAPPSAQWLQRDLRSGDLTRQLSAVRGAARPRNTDAIAPLSGVLLRLDLPASLRAAAALALGRIRDRVAATSLLQALKDPDAGVRASAALALGRLHARLAAPDLEKAVTRAGALVLGILYIFGGWKSAILLHTVNVHWLMFGLVVNWAGDTGAYYIGRRFGRLKLAPAVSPGKT